MIPSVQQGEADAGSERELPAVMVSAGGFAYNGAHIEYWKRLANERATEITRLRAALAEAERERDDFGFRLEAECKLRALAEMDRDAAKADLDAMADAIEAAADVVEAVNRNDFTGVKVALDTLVRARAILSPEPGMGK